MGQDLALVGVGLRSNVEACQQLMEQDLLGTRRFGVVRDDFDRDQVRLRLWVLIHVATSEHRTQTCSVNTDHSSSKEIYYSRRHVGCCLTHKVV